MKDLFSDHSENYSAFRPVYPAELISFLLAMVPVKDACWDVGTGNGQLLQDIAPSFHRALGTDISEQQLQFAPRMKNAQYKVCRAEEDPRFVGTFNLITVAQAIHWFNTESFYKIVNQYLAPDGLFTAVGYGLISIGQHADELIENYYHEILGPWWEPERRFIDEAYRTLPFPFEEVSCPSFTIRYSWNLRQLRGYLSTWSAYRKMVKAGHPDPLPRLLRQLNLSGDEAANLPIRFPVFLRAGHLRSS